MSWDFETDPEWAEQLRWVEEFVRRSASRSTTSSRNHTTSTIPVRQALIPPLQKSGAGAVGHPPRARSSAAQGSARSSSRC